MRISFLLLILLTVPSHAASWLLGAGVSPYHFELEQNGGLGKSNYSANVLSSYRFIAQKKIGGWIWNNELNLSFLNFSAEKKETIPLYEFHSGVQRKGFLFGLEATKNLFIDNSTDESKPLDLRSYWIAGGYRYTPRYGNWRVLGKISLPFSSKVSGDTLKSQSGYRILLAPEVLGTFSWEWLKKYSWSTGPYVDIKEWEMRAKSGGKNELRFHEIGFIFNFNRIF